MDPKLAWGLMTISFEFEMQGHAHIVYSVALSPDGFKIVLGSYGKTIQVWDASTGVEMLLLLQGHD
jgi:WD40 repeat protein